MSGTIDPDLRSKVAIFARGQGDTKDRFWQGTVNLTRR